MSTPRFWLTPLNKLLIPYFRLRETQEMSKLRYSGLLSWILNGTPTSCEVAKHFGTSLGNSYEMSFDFFPSSSPDSFYQMLLMCQLLKNRSSQALPMVALGIRYYAHLKDEETKAQGS